MKTIDDVIGRMYNWKMRSAYEYAKDVKNFPVDALVILKELSEKFGDCGWNQGSVFTELKIKNNKVAKLLGYKWDNNEDYWIKSRGRNARDFYNTRAWKDLETAIKKYGDITEIGVIVKEEGYQVTLTIEYR